MKLNSKMTLMLVALVCALPVAASYATFYFWPPEKQMNYGQLLEPTPIPPGAMTPMAGFKFDPESLEGHWVLVYVGASHCDHQCRESLYYMRQVRTALGKEMSRVKRLWLVTDDGQPDAEILQGQDGLEVAHGDAAWLNKLAKDGAPATGRVHVVDPLGLVMLRYPEQLEPKRMVRDLERLLKYSRVG